MSEDNAYQTKRGAKDATIVNPRPGLALDPVSEGGVAIPAPGGPAPRRSRTDGNAPRSFQIFGGQGRRLGTD